MSERTDKDMYGAIQAGQASGRETMEREEAWEQEKKKYGFGEPISNLEKERRKIYKKL